MHNAQFSLMKAVQAGELLKIFEIAIAFSLYFEYYDGASIVYKKEELHKGFQIRAAFCVQAKPTACGDMYHF